MQLLKQPRLQTNQHNLNVENHAIPDPDLTALGKQQCAELKAAFPFHSKITHLVSSPMRRTLYTTLLGFSEPSPNAPSSTPVIALPEIQETSALPCDTGSSPVRLAAEFSEGDWEGQVDLGLVKKGWNDKSPSTPWAPKADKLDARAKKARQFLRQLGRDSGKDAEIVVVTHGGYLHYFTQDWSGHDKFVGTGWMNTEFRSYTFKSEDDEDASLTETTASRERRRGSEIALTETEQRELKAVAEDSWMASGFQTPLKL